MSNQNEIMERAKELHEKKLSSKNIKVKQVRLLNPYALFAFITSFFTNIISLYLSYLGIKNYKNYNSGKTLSLISIIIAVLKNILIIILINIYYPNFWYLVNVDINTRIYCKNVYSCIDNGDKTSECHYEDELGKDIKTVCLNSKLKTFNYKPGANIIGDNDYFKSVKHSSFRDSENIRHNITDYNLPYINYNTDYVKAVNEDIKIISKDIIDNWNEAYKLNEEKKIINKFYTGADYKITFYNDVMSILIDVEFTENKREYHEYYSYNVNYKTGNIVTNEELFQIYSLNESDARIRIEETLISFYDKWWDSLSEEKHDKLFDTWYKDKKNETLSVLNENTLNLFIGDEDMLYFRGAIYTPYEIEGNQVIFHI